jgi:hypothetical protein
MNQITSRCGTLALDGLRANLMANRNVSTIFPVKDSVAVQSEVGIAFNFGSTSAINHRIPSQRWL